MDSLRESLNPHITIEKTGFDVDGGLVFKYPSGTKVIVVCVNEGYGFEPKKVLLPHQLYMGYVKELLKDSKVRQITLLFVKGEYLDVLKKWRS